MQVRRVAAVRLSLSLSLPLSLSLSLFLLCSIDLCAFVLDMFCYVYTGSSERPRTVLGLVVE